MTLLQIIPNTGSIDASWVLTGFAAIIAFFLIRTLNKIEKRLSNQESQMNNITLVQIKMLSKLGIDDEYYDKLSEQLAPKPGE